MSSLSYEPRLHARMLAGRRSRSFSFIVAACLAASLGACGDGGARCASSCEQNEWPRAIIGILDSAEGYGAVADLDRTGRFTLTSQVCGGELDTTRFVCSFAVYPGSEDTSARITLTDSNGNVRPATTVALAPHNYCGREIAYIEFTPSDAGGTWSEQRYISPCSLPQ